MDVILSHTHADFDCIGAMIGAKHLNPRAIIALPASLNANVRRFVGLYRDAFGMRELAELDLEQIARVILVDTQDPHRTGAGRALLERPEVTWEIVDYHPERASLSASGEREVRPVGAATTLWVSRLRAREATLSAPEATAMLLGILEDTGRLSFPSTTSEDALAIAYLISQGADFARVAEYLDPTLGADQNDLLNALLEAAEWVRTPDVEAMLFGIDYPHPVPEQSVVLERLMQLYRPTLGVMVVRSGAHGQLIARSADPDLDLRSLLAPWHVEGHPGAVSAHRAPAWDPREVIGAVRARLEALPRRGTTARMVMSAPVRTLGFDVTAREALECLRQWGHTAMPVVHRGRVQGVISRRDLDRALHHGFGDRAIKGLVARRVEAVSPDTPLADVRRRMVSRDLGRLLVMQDEDLVGIITRSDLIRVLDHLDRTPGALKPTHRDLAERLGALWPSDWIEALREVGRIAGDRPIYLVGGAVRDLVLGRASFDMDLVVEGEAIEVARDLAEVLGASVKVHAAFGTAHVTLSSEKHLDLATARIEHYPHPGALPVVSRAGVRQDLARRDFTVNALAMRINPDGFGELLDFFGGLADLEARTIRVLHPISFIEDPVRLFRGVRFEIRLGFRMDDSTEAYARFALESGRFDGMASERLKLEFRLGLGLERVAGLVFRLADLDAWRVLHPALGIAEGTRRALQRLDRLRAGSRGPRDPDAWLPPLALLLLELTPEARLEAIEPLNLKREERHLLEASWQGHALLGDLTGGSYSDPELARMLESLPLQALWVAAAATGQSVVRRRLWRYATQLHAVRLVRVNGAWLKARGLEPGPLFKEVLAALLDAKRAGSLASPEAEEAMARAWLGARGYQV